LLFNVGKKIFFKKTKMQKIKNYLRNQTVQLGTLAVFLFVFGAIPAVAEYAHYNGPGKAFLGKIDIGQMATNVLLVQYDTSVYDEQMPVGEGGDYNEGTYPAGEDYYQQGDNEGKPEQSGCGYYDQNGAWIVEECGQEGENYNAAGEGGSYGEEEGDYEDKGCGYYDQSGAWIAEECGQEGENYNAAGEGGSYGEEEGDYEDKGCGYYDQNRNWIPTPCDEAGEDWNDTASQDCGYYDQSGSWVSTSCDEQQQYEPSEEDVTQWIEDAEKWLKDRQKEVDRRNKEMNRWVRNFAREAERTVKQVERELLRGWIDEAEAERRLAAAEAILAKGDHYTAENDQNYADFISYFDHLTGLVNNLGAGEIDNNTFWQQTSASDLYWLRLDALSLLIESDERSREWVLNWQSEADRLIQEYTSIGFEDAIPQSLYDVQDLVQKSVDAMGVIQKDVDGIYQTLMGMAYTDITDFEVMQDLRDEYQDVFMDYRDDLQILNDDLQWEDPWSILNQVREQRGVLEQSAHMQKEISFIRQEIEKGYEELVNMPSYLQEEVKMLFEKAEEVLDKMDGALSVGEPWKAEQGFQILDQIKRQIDRLTMGIGGGDVMNTKSASIQSFQSTLGVDNDPAMAFMVDVLNLIPENILNEAIGMVVNKGLSENFQHLLGYKDFNADQFIKGLPHFGDDAENIVTIKSSLFESIDSMNTRIADYKADGKTLRANLLNSIEAIQGVAADYIFIGDQADQMEGVLEAVDDAVGNYFEGELSLDELTTEIDGAQDTVEQLQGGNTAALFEAGVTNFTDVNPAEWFYTYVEEASDEGIVSGYKDAAHAGMYGAGDQLVVNQILKMALEAAFKQIPNSGVSANPKVHGDWSESYFAYGENLGLNMNANENLKGVDPFRFAARDEVLHLALEVTAKAAGMSTMDLLKIVLGTTNSADLKPTYLDVLQSDAEFLYVEAATRLGVVSGNPDGTFAPKRGVNRAEAAKIIINFGNVIETFGVSDEEVEVNEIDDQYIEDVFNQASAENYYSSSDMQEPSGDVKNEDINYGDEDINMEGDDDSGGEWVDDTLDENAMMSILNLLNRLVSVIF